DAGPDQVGDRRADHPETDQETTVLRHWIFPPPSDLPHSPSGRPRAPPEGSENHRFMVVSASGDVPFLAENLAPQRPCRPRLAAWSAQVAAAAGLSATGRAIPSTGGSPRSVTGRPIFRARAISDSVPHSPPTA